MNRGMESLLRGGHMGAPRAEEITLPDK